MKDLTVIHLKAGSKYYGCSGGTFALSTCQRTIVVGFHSTPFYFIKKAEEIVKIYQGADAYTFLLETILGLQSKIQGEYEVVNQFKEAFAHYIKKGCRNSKLQKVMEKLFFDHKKIRSQFLMDIGTNSYAGITRSIINKNQPKARVLILGTGQLAIQNIKLLEKKYELTVSGRNLEKLAEIQKMFEIETVPFMDKTAYGNFDVIVNTIGADQILFDSFFMEDFFNHSGKLFIDSGSPSVVETMRSTSEGMYRLTDILTLGENRESEKLEKINKAKAEVYNLKRLYL